MDKDITVYFPSGLSAALEALKRCDINELRLRADKPAALVTRSGILYLTPEGKAVCDSPAGIIVKGDDLKKIFDAACQYSLHSHYNRVAQCFVTLPGGHRLGISGTAVYNSSGSVETVRDITGINFRIARQVTGAADKIVNDIMKYRLQSILLCGEPGSGKTTVLRDLCRQLGAEHTICLVDERSEIAAVSRGRVNNDVGTNTDVLNGFTKHDGISAALRVMSPEMIVCDEIGSEDDVKAILDVCCCGVKLAASVHGRNRADIFGRSGIKQLVDAGAFDYAVFIRRGEITKIINIGDRTE